MGPSEMGWKRYLAYETCLLFLSSPSLTDSSPTFYLIPKAVTLNSTNARRSRQSASTRNHVTSYFVNNPGTCQQRLFPRTRDLVTSSLSCLQRLTGSLLQTQSMLLKYRTPPCPLRGLLHKE
ncbi:hypothetical protein BJV78DRAFT_1260586 [Lactifluus subvellereus]|nr:hypothetical protein BJV78DRAFT_1260586 [Lactifluus subvellereus]